jgi:hypothetical protein
VDDSIPEHIQEAEPEDNSGYSVPVSSEVEGRAPEKVPTPPDETYSTHAPEHPRKNAEYSVTPDTKAKPELTQEESPEEMNPRRQAEAAAAAAKNKPVPEQESAPAAKPRPEAIAAAALEKLAARRNQNERAAATAPRATAPAEAGARAQPAAPVTETHLPAAEPTRTEEVTRTAGQVTAPAKEEIKIKDDPAAEQIQTEVALDGTPDQSGEEIRIRAREEGDSSHGERKARAPGENPLKYRHFVTMTLAELSDRDSSWHPMHRYRIYLSASHRYYGVKDPATLLPLWVYEGELAPEFLEDKRAWKFYDRYPELYSTLDTLPPVVLDQIYVMAGKAPPSSYDGAKAANVAGSAQAGTAPAPLATAPGETAAGGGLWGSVKSFFRTLLGG